MYGFSAYAQTPYASTAGAATPSIDGAVNETVTATDSLNTDLTALIVVAETATGTDAISSLATFNATTTETATASETVVSEYIFNLVVCRNSHRCRLY